MPAHPSPPDDQGLHARDLWTVGGLLAAATAAALLLDPYVTLTSQAMLYVLAVVLAAYTRGRAASLLCVAAAVMLLNFLFVPPRYTFRVDAQENVFALVALLSVALVISHLVDALRRETAAARLSERRATQLQAFSAELAGASAPAGVLLLTQQFLGRAFAGPSRVALLTGSGELELPEDMPQLTRDGIKACIREAATLGPGTGRWPGLNAWFIPLKSETHIGGAACIESVAAADEAGREHAQLMCTLAGGALWRMKLAADVHAAEALAQWHRAQNTFLAGISHDFRTPLAAIVGAASSLQTQHDKHSAADRDRLLGAILREAEHLTKLTDNTLQLVRLENAGELHMDWQSAEEIVGSVLSRIRERDVSHRIRSQVPAGLPLIKADPVLLAQLLENLLDNALKYSVDTIELEVQVRMDALEIAVHDRGDGIRAGDELAIFDAYRRGDTAGYRGAGLGLAVCRAIAHAHGAEIRSTRRAGGGTTFALSLPVPREQPGILPA